MSRLPAPDNKISIDVKDGINDDIIDTLERRFPEAVKEAAPAAASFKGRNRIATANNIWQWLKNGITYRKDPDGYQDVRMPRYFHHTKTGDCKSFTLNTLALWANIYPEDKIRFFYAGYAPGAKTPTHVYAKINPSDGSRQIIIDGCWHFVNSEKNYTFGKYSPNMTVRTLSDNTSEAHDMPNKLGHDSPAMRRLYRGMTPADRERMRSCMGDMVQLELLKKAKDLGMDHDKIQDALNEISAKHHAKGKKDGHKNKKAMHIFNASNPVMLLGRSCFLLAVSLNLNGLASKLGMLNKWGYLNHVLDFWYIIGGSPKKFLKIIAHSAKKKKLFLSKKAKRKYEARYGPLSPGEVAYEKSHGMHDEIGVAPAIIAAVVGMIPVLAGIIPKMIQAFKAASPTHPEAAREANGLASEGHDLVDAVQKGGYPLSASDVDAVMGHAVTGPDGKPLPTSHGGGPGGGGAHLFQFADKDFVFDWHNLHVMSGISDDTAEQQAYDAEHYATPSNSSDSPGLVTLPPNPAPDNTMQTLGPLLQTITTAGLATASNVMAQSQNPNIRKWGGALGEADSILAGKNLQAAGYHDEANWHHTNADIHGRGRVNLFPLALGAVVVVGGYELFKSKQSQSPAMNGIPYKPVLFGLVAVGAAGVGYNYWIQKKASEAA